MARSRQIKPDFFLNESLAAVPPQGRLLFIGLWLIADREGRLEDRPARIKAQLFPYEDVDVDGLLQTLNRNFIARYEVEGVRLIEITHFKKHQHIHPDEKRSLFPRFPGFSGTEPDLPGLSSEDRKSPEIPGDYKKSRGIMPCSSSSSSSPSSSPSSSTDNNRPERRGPNDLKAEIRKTAAKLSTSAAERSGDYGDYRLPKTFGKYGGAYVANVPADECAFLLDKMKPGPMIAAALRWRIALKAEESNGGNE